ncbi:MAG: class A beta-lactamase, subclass A2 [Bacteroidetes bacterium]|nr:class A beta-lactamase, subclass A2 [Bacteroidota bacterium]
MIRLLQRLILICIVSFSQAQDTGTAPLRTAIERIVAGKDVVVGVSVLSGDGRDTLSLNGSRRFPLQSVFKFHIAAAVLQQIDQRRFALTDSIEVRGPQLLPGLWSPLREEHPNGGWFTIAALIRYSVSQSDNAACDALLRLAGGPAAVERFFHSNGITDIAIVLNEETMQKDWEQMFLNWSTPLAATEAVRLLYVNRNGLLSTQSHRFLWTVMRETETGLKRLKGNLPPGTAVLHKTGSSGTNSTGITEAVNDIGIIVLPDGRHIYISVFVSRSRENSETNERIIAEIAKAAYDHFTGRPKKN